MIKIAIESICCQSKRAFHSTSAQYAGKIWRQKHGLPKLQTGLKIFDTPDYSYLDGRPVPLTSGQLKRKKLQEELCNEIVESLNYIKYGQEVLSKEKEELIKQKENSSEAVLMEKAIDLDGNSNDKDRKTRRSSRKVRS